MSDQNKFVNAYIDASVSTLHEFLNQILQNKAQLKVATESVATLQAELNALRSELEIHRTDKSEKDNAIQKATTLEHTNHALQNKVAHLETALNQIAEMKKVVIDKDAQIRSLEEQIEELKAPKKVINRKKPMQANAESVVINTEPELAKTDDF